MPGNFAESFVRLRYTPGTANVNDGKPALDVADFWGAFSDFVRQQHFEDQDLGSAGVVLIPERGNLIGGGKDGILYNLNKDNLGKNTLGSAFQSAVRRHLSAQSAERRRGTAHDDRRQSELADRRSRSQSPCADADRKTFHVHGTPVFMGACGERDPCSCGARTNG